MTSVVLVFGLVTFPEFRFAGGMLTATQAAWCSESANEAHYVPEVKDAVACIDPARIPLFVQHTQKYLVNKLKQARYQTLNKEIFLETAIWTFYSALSWCGLH